LKLFKNIADNLLQFIAPRVCLICNDRLSGPCEGDFVCRTCLDNIPLAPPGDILLNRIESMQENRDYFYLSGIYSFFKYNDENVYACLIRELKYHSMWKIGIELGGEFGRLLKYIPGFGYDAILPVPIHAARKRERGYNQAEMISRGISRETGIPVDIRIIRRKKYTTTQTKLSKEARRKNVSRVFEVVKGAGTQGKSFLLVDDVLTTGSTLNACAEALLESGARRVDAATLAVADHT